jgi:galactokinase
LDTDVLLATAKEGGFYSYVAGVAYHILLTNEVQGIEIDNFKTDLPLQKGLSSSAAVCVLVARAFNRAYDLKYTTRGEMELAYKGEIATPSKCGRMDQCVAFGSTPVFMTFDGDFMRCEPLTLPPSTSLFYVIVDLKASKDTTEILGSLSARYPSPSPDATHNFGGFFSIDDVWPRVAENSLGALPLLS